MLALYGLLGSYRDVSINGKSSLFKEQISQGENTMINQITRYMLDEVELPIPLEKERKVGKIQRENFNIQLTHKNY